MKLFAGWMQLSACFPFYRNQNVVSAILQVEGDWRHYRMRHE